MLHDYSSVHLDTFVVRIWREASGLAWRGEVIHLPDRIARRFANLSDLDEFIEPFLTPNPGEPQLHGRPGGNDQ